jgi:predicted nucleic acid-binding protein
MPADFFDSNVLLYLAADPAKAERSRALLQIGGTISVQVLNEVANVARRKMRLSWEETEELLDLIRSLVEVVDLCVSDHEFGLALARRYQLGIYDSMIVASALAAGCDRLYSEDMHDGLVIDGRLRIENPFHG